MGFAGKMVWIPAGKKKESSGIKKLKRFIKKVLDVNLEFSGNFGAVYDILYEKKSEIEREIKWPGIPKECFDYAILSVFVEKARLLKAKYDLELMRRKLKV